MMRIERTNRMVNYDQLKPSKDELAQACATLGFKNNMIKQALIIYEKAVTQGFTRPRKRTAVLTSCALISAGLAGYPVMVRDVCLAFQSREKEVLRVKKALKAKLKIKESEDVHDLIRLIGSRLGLKPAEITKAQRRINGEGYNKAPRILAATAVYLASNKTLKEVTEVSGASATSINETKKLIGVNR